MKKPHKAPAKTEVKPEPKAETKSAKPREFALKRGDGNKVFTGFNPATDRIVFDYGSHADTMFDGPVSDGTSFRNEGRTANWHVRAMGDDTLITVDADTIKLVGVKAEQLRGWNFSGG